MIGINECNPNIASIEKRHAAFVEARIRSSLYFYRDVFALMNTCRKKSVKNAIFNSKVNAIKQKYDCTQYKDLLNQLLKAKYKVKDKTQAYLVSKPKNLTMAIKSNTSIISALDVLLTNYRWLVSANFNAVPTDFTKLQKIEKQTVSAKFLLPSIFDYAWFRDQPIAASWGAYQLSGALRTNTCPYCNRQYIYTVFSVSGKKIARPQLDHFLPQSRHPLLSLSFYNLVPSCSVCNASVKLGNETSYTTHFSPFLTNSKHGLMKFSYKPKSYAASIGESEDLEIDLAYSGDPANKQLKMQVEGNIDLFCLKDVYANHHDIVAEIIRKREATNDSYIKITQDTFKMLKLTEADVYRIAFGNYFREEEFAKRPLSKLMKDIAHELAALIKYP